MKNDAEEESKIVIENSGGDSVSDSITNILKEGIAYHLLHVPEWEKCGIFLFYSKKWGLRLKRTENYDIINWR